MMGNLVVRVKTVNSTMKYEMTAGMTELSRKKFNVYKSCRTAKRNTVV